jgi:hypothetical protein
MVREKQKEQLVLLLLRNISQTGGIGEWRGKILFERADNEPLGLGYAQNLWDGCFRAAVLKAAPGGSTTDVPDV